MSLNPTDPQDDESREPAAEPVADAAEAALDPLAGPATGTVPAPADPRQRPGFMATWRRLATSSDPGETALHVFFSLLVAVGSVFAASLVIVIPVMIRQIGAGGEPDDMQALLSDPAIVLTSLLATQVPLLLIGWWRSRGLDRAERDRQAVAGTADVFGDDSPPRSPTWSIRGSVGFGLLMGGLALAATMVIGRVQEWLGLPVTEQEAILAILEGGGLPMIAFALLGTTFVPLSEEIFFRHYLFRRVLRGFGYWAGAIFSSLAFAAIHFNPSGILAYVTYGMLFAWARQRSGRTLSCVVGHVTVNATTFGIYLISKQLGIDLE